MSAASAWEAATKRRIGKLPGAEPILDGYAGHLARLRVAEVPIDGRAALLAGGLVWDHRDPFDRMIVANAILSDSILLSADRRLDEVVGVRLRW